MGKKVCAYAPNRMWVDFMLVTLTWVGESPTGATLMNTLLMIIQLVAPPAVSGSIGKIWRIYRVIHTRRSSYDAISQELATTRSLKRWVFADILGAAPRHTSDIHVSPGKL